MDKTTKPVEIPSFEQAIKHLQSIVESMEAGDVSLADLLVRFEEGNKLLKICETRLKEAELRIEQYKKRKDGTAALDAFPPATPEF
ncbi:MAG: exodeoxyribonuclease VII small subunit [Opitutaceae bacterium]|nr:exodeoxyribonuclease VII small subunit [Opitutaceae bacterium]